MIHPTSDEATNRLALARYQRMRRLVLFVMILLLGSALFFVSSAWGDGKVHEYIEMTGIGLIVAGILGRVWSILYIGGRKSNSVVRDGPYSIMRNPLYFFSAIAAAGAGAQTGTIMLAIGFFLITVVAFHIVIFREEAFLAGMFGAPYEDYLATVPRFFPNPGLFKDPESIEVSTRAIYSTFLDGLVFFVALPVLELIEEAQEAGLLPVLAHLY